MYYYFIDLSSSPAKNPQSPTRLRAIHRYGGRIVEELLYAVCGGNIEGEIDQNLIIINKFPYRQYQDLF